MNEIILLGAGGHCKSIIDVIEQEGRFKIAGIVDNNLEMGSKILEYQVIGRDSDLNSLREKYNYAFIAVGQIGLPATRVKLYNLLKELDYILPTIISPLAYVSRYVKIQEGTIVMHHALVNADAQIGKNCIINSKALIEHDCIVKDFSHISTGAVVNGAVRVQEGTFYGSNATSKEGIDVNGFIKAGSVAK